MPNNSSGPRHEAGTIDGVRVTYLDQHCDERGSFTEVFCDHWGTGVEPTQWSVIRSAGGVLRGMHLHWRHDEYFHVIDGVATVGLHDLRASSPTEGKAEMIEVRGDRPACVTFPAGVVHGWLFHVPSIHLQAVSESYIDYGGDDNGGCHWSDPDLAIEWPLQPSVVSPRSSAFGSLAALREGRRSP